MKLHRKIGSEHARVDLTPLLDCAMQLVLFFLLLASSGPTDDEVLFLPVVSEEAMVDEGPDYCGVRAVLNVLADGSVWIKGQCFFDPAQPDGLAKLRTHLQRIVRFMPKSLADEDRPVGDDNPLLPDGRLLIRADKDCPVEHVQRFLDLVQEDSIRIWKIELAAREPSGPTGPPLLDWGQ